MDTPSNIKTFKSISTANSTTNTSVTPTISTSATPAIKHNANPLSISKNLLATDKSTRGPSCGLIVVDNFYQNAMATRDFILTQEFSVRGNYPGSRTISHATEQLRAIIQKYVEPFGGKITDFPLPSPATATGTGTGTAAKETYNGSFQYTTSRDRSWVHTDGFNNWAGVLFLTPDAPLSSGTGFFRFHDGTTCVTDQKLLNNKSETDTFSQDMTKWSLVDQVGNVFNRLVLFNANNFHMSMDYFGDRSTNGRLFQVFFFSTER